jgi:hypothetical protein
VAGESLGYLAGRVFGYRIRYGRLGRRLGHHNWERAESFLARRGGPAVFASRFVAAIHALVPVAAGTLGMPYRTFLRWCAAGAIAWSTIYIGLGMAAGLSYRELDYRLGAAGYGILVVLLAALLAAWVMARWPRHQGREVPGRGGHPDHHQGGPDARPRRRRPLRALLAVVVARLYAVSGQRTWDGLPSGPPRHLPRTGHRHPRQPILVIPALARKLLRVRDEFQLPPPVVNSLLGGLARRSAAGEAPARWSGNRSLPDHEPRAPGDLVGSG